MPWSGSSGSQTFGRTDGTRTGTQVWTQADAASVDIVAPDHDVHDQDMADGINAALKKDGGNTATANLPMGGFKHTNVGAATARADYARFSDLQDGKGIYAPTVGGSANTITLTTGYTVPAYAAGQAFTFVAAYTNTGAATLNVDGLGAKNIYGPGLTALNAGQIMAGGVVRAIYDGTQFQIETSTPSTISVGTVMAWPSATVPSGWLECNGAAVSRTTYAALFAAIGVTYGPGDSSTTFNLPDYRGYFLRGHDAGAGADPDAASRTNRGDGTTGDNVGTKQAGAVASHTHAAGTLATASDGAHTHDVSAYTDAGSGNPSLFFNDSGSSQSTITSASNGAHTHTISGSTAATGDNETRPKNIGVKWIILAFPTASLAVMALAPPSSFSTLTLADDAADWLQVYDTSASEWKKVLGQNLGFTPAGTGAVLRPLQGKARERVSVLDFVTVSLHAGILDGTNATDLTAFFQAAVDSVASGKRLLIDVPPGTYLLNSNVTDNGRLPVFWLQPGALFTGAGQITTQAIQFDGDGFNVQRGFVGVGGQSSGTGAVLIGGGDLYQGPYGVALASDGHADWLKMQSNVTDNATELVLYGNHAQGRATSTMGGNTLTRVSGTSFSSSWVGRKLWWNQTEYLVASVNVGAQTLTVTTLGGGGVSFAGNDTAFYARICISIAGVCSTSGTAVTRVSGQPFLVGLLSDITINGVSYGISSIASGDAMTLSSSAGTQTSVAYYAEVPYATAISDEMSKLRVQRFQGSDEEGISLLAKPDEYLLTTYAAGSGAHDNLIVRINDLRLADFAPGGWVSLGGASGSEALRAIRTANQVNRIDAYGALTGTTPALSVSGSDTNISFGFDTQGTGDFFFTSNSFAATQAQIDGAAASTTGWPSLYGGTGVANVAAVGDATNVNLVLTAKGSGTVSSASSLVVTGYEQITSATNTYLQLTNTGGGKSWYAISTTAGSFSFYDGTADRYSIDSSGRPIWLPGSTTPATLTANGQITMTLTSNTNIRLSARGTDGTTRVADITIA